MFHLKVRVNLISCLSNFRGIGNTMKAINSIWWEISLTDETEILNSEFIIIILIRKIDNELVF